VSNVETAPAETRCGGLTEVATRPVNEVFLARTVTIGEASDVRRLLPNLGRRLVGPWCFVDHYGPDDIASEPGMQVPPHPHIGLQTVSWLLDGAVHHRDSLGSDQVLQPGCLGVMTAGRGIAHAEQSPAAHPALLHGVQLWVALPDAHRQTAPVWEFHSALPVQRDRSSTITVFMGSLAGADSPAMAYSPLVGADIKLAAGADILMPLECDFENAVLVMAGSAEVDGTRLEPGAMLYLGCSRDDVRMISADGARLMLLGGEPFDEQIVMWWNFVGRSHEEIVAARTSWIGAGDQFPDVPGYDGFRLPAPELPPGALKPGGAVR
jgi:redox-sensitive bicupin YhaK (pirin superfamily)